MEASVLAVRRENPVWGGRKIAASPRRRGGKKYTDHAGCSPLLVADRGTAEIADRTIALGG